MECIVDLEAVSLLDEARELASLHFEVPNLDPATILCNNQVLLSTGQAQ